MWLYRLNHAMGPLLGAYWPIRLEGRIDVVPREGPLLVVTNHTSFLDPWFVGMAFPRHVRYLINRTWYDRSAVWRAVFDAFGTLPIEAADPDATTDAVCRALALGNVVGVFPEGRISDDGRMRPFRKGIARMAARSAAPVLPVGIHGAHDSLPRHRRWPRRIPVTVRVGEPVLFPGAPLDGVPSSRETRGFLDRLQEEVVRLSAPPTDSSFPP